MNKYKTKFKVVFILCIVILMVTFLFLILRRGAVNPNPEIDAFAKCLNDKGITMYGANWCSHCQNEKRGFGNSFKFVPYVECPLDPQKCLALGVNAFPTWIFPDGKKLVGEQGLEKLANESGCELHKLTTNN